MADKPGRPGEHLEEEPQEERGPKGSRDLGSTRASGGPAERPAGGSDEEADTSVKPRGAREPGAPNLPTGSGG